ncbi:hypothetical protein CRUP_032586 [Coryphaenoides rupestris]|nr:hypothetical protein CRUP_032586 [Coryphaenoides rupestris]
MGARVARMFRNVNLESRVMREISREKPAAAPRHPAEGEAAGVSESIHQRSDPLLSLLKTVYVESKDPQPSEAAKPTAEQQPRRGEEEEEEERRTLTYSLAGGSYGLAEITDVPKGKLSLVEALKALNSHKMQPAVWSAERLAQEYALTPSDTKAMLEFFVPFNVKIIATESGDVKKISDS